MDKRLKLTAKQKKLVKQFEDALKDLEKENIGIMGEHSGGYLFCLRFYNKEEVLDSGSVEDCMGSDTYEEYDEDKFNGYYSNAIEDKSECVVYTPYREELQLLDLPIYHIEEYVEDDDSEKYEKCFILKD